MCFLCSFKKIEGKVWDFIFIFSHSPTQKSTTTTSSEQQMIFFRYYKLNTQKKNHIIFIHCIFLWCLLSMLKRLGRGTYNRHQIRKSRLNSFSYRCEFHLFFYIYFILFYFFVKYVNDVSFALIANKFMVKTAILNNQYFIDYVMTLMTLFKKK